MRKGKTGEEKKLFTFGMSLEIRKIRIRNEPIIPIEIPVEY